MQSVLMFLCGPLAAFIVSVVLCRVVMQAGLMDRPVDERKRQINTKATPSSGGVGFLAAALLAASVIHLLQSGNFPSPTSDFGLLLLGIVGAMLLGLADDMIALMPQSKLIGQFCIAFAMAAYGLRIEEIMPGFDKVREFGLYGGLFLTTLWIMTLMNAVNFMDGANGLSMGIGVFVSLGFAGVASFAGLPEIALVALLCAGALIGFLIWNVPGRLFAGDAGALGLGVAFGGLSIWLVKLRPDLVFVPPILLSPYLVDVVLTLLYRMRRGDPFWKAHNDHVFQIILRATSLEHWQMSLIYWVMAINAAALAFAASLIGQEAPLLVFVGFTLLSALLHIRTRRLAIARGRIQEEQRG